MPLAARTLMLTTSYEDKKDWDRRMNTPDNIKESPTRHAIGTLEVVILEYHISHSEIPSRQRAHHLKVYYYTLRFRRHRPMPASRPPPLSPSLSTEYPHRLLE